MAAHGSSMDPDRTMRLIHGMEGQSESALTHVTTCVHMVGHMVRSI